MKIESLKLVCFSPTGTTKKIIQAISHGININAGELTDITRPGARKQPLQLSEQELLIVGVPVYMGRVPAIITDWLHMINAQNTPAVCVVVYGNRAFEDALIELSDILNDSGCKTIAAAAYIGEHSFSSKEIPTAKDRPDSCDLHNAEAFGKRIQEKLNTILSFDKIGGVIIPGFRPYRWDGKLWTVDFLAVSNACTHCGLCADVCPVGAIDPANSNLIDREKCITCCACIKNCPENARSMKPGMVKDAAIRLNKLYKERKEPEFFI